AWERYKYLLRACPHHGFTELHELDTFYNALNPADQDSLNAAAGGNLLEKSPQDALTIIENKSKVRNSRSKLIASQVNACDNHSSSELAKLTQAVNQQTSTVTTAMTAMLKQFQSNPPPAQVKAVEEICVTCGGAHPYYQCLAASGNTFPEYWDNNQGYVSAATGNFNQGNPSYRPQCVANQMRLPGFAQPNVQNNQNRFGQPQGFNRGQNFNQEQPYQATQSNQNFHLNELEKIKRMNDGRELSPAIPLPTRRVNLKPLLLVVDLLLRDLPFPNPPKSVNLEEDECVEETYTDPDHAEYNIKVPPPPPVQKPKHPIQRNFVLHTRDSLPPHIPYPSRALVLMPKYQKILIALLSNKEKLQKLANTPLNENCSVVILKKLPEKLRDPGKFLIPCLPDLIPTRMTLELANRAICTPDGIARDVFVPVGKFPFPADFVVVDYESDPRVPLILGRPFLRTARALIDVHGKEMILRDGDERLTLNMKHDTASYSNHPRRDSVNLINIFNLSDINSFNDIHPYYDDDPLSGSTTYSANSLLEEFADELALITYPPDYDDNRACDIEDDVLPSPDNEDKVFYPGILSH
nr:reverse transcriptase domain-containing protein [Tanacetum cinerariifolium]